MQMSLALMPRFFLTLYDYPKHFKTTTNQYSLSINEQCELSEKKHIWLYIEYEDCMQHVQVVYASFLRQNCWDSNCCTGK